MKQIPRGHWFVLMTTKKILDAEEIISWPHVDLKSVPSIITAGMG